MLKSALGTVGGNTDKCPKYPGPYDSYKIGKNVNSLPKKSLGTR